MKNHHHNGPIHPTSRERIHESIAKRAYELWEAECRPDNSGDAHWLQAESEIMTEAGMTKDAPAGSKTEPKLPVSF
jgi:hypothetical protein